MKSSIVLWLLFLGIANEATIATAQSVGMFAATGDLTTERSGHTSTLLGNGRVLIAGGVGLKGNQASADLYDPSAGTFTATGDMTESRFSHTATLLPDGKVLIVGGGRGPHFSAELYDPATGTFTATGKRPWHSLLQLRCCSLTARC